MLESGYRIYKGRKQKNNKVPGAAWAAGDLDSSGDGCQTLDQLGEMFTAWRSFCSSSGSGAAPSWCTTSLITVRGTP